MSAFVNMLFCVSTEEMDFHIQSMPICEIFESYLLVAGTQPSMMCVIVNYTG